MRSQKSRLVSHRFPALPPSRRMDVVVPTQLWNFRKVIRTTQWNRGRQPPWGVGRKTQSFPAQCCLWPWHLGLVQHLSLGLAGLGDLLIPGPDLGNDVTEVQAAVVIHGQHHRHVAGLGLQLVQLLPGRLTQCPLAPASFPLGAPGKVGKKTDSLPTLHQWAALIHTEWH